MTSKAISLLVSSKIETILETNRILVKLLLFPRNPIIYQRNRKKVKGGEIERLGIVIILFSATTILSAVFQP
ncbi:hypothetical protein, partial [Bacteroides acidifaciens]|uniref:hypothetical protein n=1 Tax=Bacteroides acidifaciens TaxID=85831 RepID=UPI00242F25F9